MWASDCQSVSQPGSQQEPSRWKKSLEWNYKSMNMFYRRFVFDYVVFNSRFSHHTPPKTWISRDRCHPSINCNLLLTANFLCMSAMPRRRLYYDLWDVDGWRWISLVNECRRRATTAPGTAALSVWGLLPYHSWFDFQTNREAAKPLT